MASVPWTPELTALSRVFSDLFRDETTARNVTEEAGVPTALIDWREPSYMRWQSIVEEARRREMLPQLVMVAKAWYEESSTLQEAIETWEKTLTKKTSGKQKPVPEIQELLGEKESVISALRATVADQEGRIKALEEEVRQREVEEDKVVFDLFNFSKEKITTTEWTPIGDLSIPSSVYRFALCIKLLDKDPRSRGKDK